MLTYDFHLLATLVNIALLMGGVLGAVAYLILLGAVLGFAFGVLV